jgi:tripartite-type tricarboxylate transporter receptor subunit TctC
MFHSHHRLLHRLLSLAAVVAVSGAAYADNYPSKPIRIIVPYPAGGVVDVQTRAMTAGLSVEIGQSIVVEARPGANGNIAAESVAKAAPDGYTLLVSAPFIINNPLLEGASLRWSPANFLPIGRFSLSPSYFLVPAASPARDLKEFMTIAARANPPLQHGTTPGSTQAMAVEMLTAATGVKFEPVNYKGAPPAALDLIAQRLAFGIVPSSVAYPYVKDGRLRALANTSSSRSAQLPDVPTAAEAGYPQITVISWYGLHAPAGTPVAVLDRLDRAMKAAVARSDVQERLVTAGGEAAFLDRQAFIRFLAEDETMWKRINDTLKK